MAASTASKGKSTGNADDQKLRENEKPSDPVSNIRTKTLARKGQTSKVKSNEAPVAEEKISLNLKRKRLDFSPPKPDQGGSSSQDGNGLPTDMQKEADVKSGDEALALLQQWRENGYFKGIMGRDAISGHPKLWQVWKQEPKFPDNFVIDMFEGTAAKAGFWWQFVKTTTAILQSPKDASTEFLVGKLKFITQFKKHNFNTRLLEMALSCLLSRRLASCIRSRNNSADSKAVAADLERLEEERDDLQTKLEEIQIDLELKENQVKDCKNYQKLADEIEELEAALASIA